MDYRLRWIITRFVFDRSVETADRVEHIRLKEQSQCREVERECQELTPVAHLNSPRPPVGSTREMGLQPPVISRTAMPGLVDGKVHGAKISRLTTGPPLMPDWLGSSRLF